ncbi:MAG: SpoIIE family protein phosphatase [Spirochaetia bacterium]|nr:SpoIIE family protein phosphatase [Spirochaetia bacterium]
MSLFENFYLNYYSIGALIPFIFTIAIGLFLIRLPEKKESTLFFGKGFFLLGIFNFGYVIAASFYHPFAAYHRWITVATILPLLLYFGQFFFYFRDCVHKKTAKIFYYVKWTISIIVTIVFIIYTFSSEKIFHPYAQHWDFNADEISAIVAIIILIFILGVLVAAVLKMIVLKGKDRWGIFGMAVSFVISSVFPSILNSFSREGLIDRGTYQIIYDVLILFGLSGLIIIFLNLTKEKTTFMVKIVGVSLVIFLVGFQMIMFSILKDSEDAYDKLHSQMTLNSFQTNYISRDLNYVTLISLKDFTYTNIYQRKNITLDYKNLETELLNTYLWKKINNLKDYEFSSGIQYILDNSHENFLGYKTIINKYLTNLNDIQMHKAGVLLDYVSSFDNLITYNYNMINKKKLNKVKKLLNTKNIFTSQEFYPFIESVKNKFKDIEFNSAKDKNNLLNYFTKFKNPNERRFREDIENKSHYFSFISIDFNNEKIYEAGYSYLDYRIHMHSKSFNILIIFFCIIFFIFLIPVFLKNSLVNPLRTLLKGVEMVNKGNLDAVIPVNTKDEIGFIAQTFNKMVKSVQKANIKLQNHADILEDTVAERTRELQESFEKIQSLKIQQDGDYFLTSLLLNPLGLNTVKSDTVSIEFLMKQNKKFRFKKWRKELGGDICIAHSIILKDKQYSVFLNADAMGKSMQGAGGILVLGAVFQSIIERTKYSDELKNKYPEAWIKNAFVELHKVFESFEGSMLISLIIGIIDDELGLMHFLNAEHPYPVLYRDNKAVFIEEKTIFRKLGTVEVSGIIHTPTIHLKKGDIVFIGSDGRDDLILGYDENNNKIINKDENLFLKIVEESKGSLRNIFKNMLKKGQLTDDLSLLKLSYKQDNTEVNIFSEVNIRKLITEAKIKMKENNYNEALLILENAKKLNNSSPETIRNLLKIFIMLKDYKKAALAAEDYITLKPADTEHIYIASYCYKKMGNFIKSKELSERIYLRNPKHLKNLINLAGIYLKLSKYKEALLYVGEALEMDPNNNKASKIKNILLEKNKTI